MSVDLSVDLGKFQLKNPVVTASGLSGTARSTTASTTFPVWGR